MSPATILTKLNELGVSSALRVVWNLVEGRFCWYEISGIYETPGGTCCWKPIGD